MFHKLAQDIYKAALIKLAFKANQNNFAHGTTAVFSKTTKRPNREPDKKSPKKGSNSEYWVTPMGVVRGSDHWGTVGTCNWDLAGSPDHPGKKVYGFSPWENFSKKTAALDTIQHYTKSGPKDQISKSVSQWHDENPEAAEAFLLDLYNKLGWKNNNPAKYMKTRHELENWMYEQLPQLGIKADTKYPTYGSLDLGYTPEVFQDMESHLDIPLKGLEDKVTFSIGDSIPVLGKADPASRKLYSLKDIQNMPLDEVIEKVKASTNNSRGQDYLEAQIWANPEKLQQAAKLVEKEAEVNQLLHYTKTDPHDQISQSITQYHHQHPRKAEKILQAIWESRNASGDVKAKIKKYFKKRHALEDWMYNKLPEMGIEASTKYPVYAFSDLGYTPDVLKDEVNNSHFQILVDSLKDKITFTPGDSIMNKMMEQPEEQRMFYTLDQINKMKPADLQAKIDASAGTHGHNFLEAQIWTTPEELQQVAKLIEKTGSKKVLKGYYDMTPEEQEAARNSLGEHESVYLSNKPLGRGYEGSAYPVLTKDLGEAIRKNFNGCYGETPHLQRMIELKGNKIDQKIRDLFNNGEFEKAYELYASDNPRKRMRNRLDERLQVLLNPDNADLFAALSKTQPRRIHENIGGGVRDKELGHGGIIMEKLDIHDSTDGFTEADFIAMNTDLAERIMKAHIGDSPAYGTDFPEEFTTPNGEIGATMRFAPVLRGLNGKLYQIKDIRNVYNPDLLPPMFKDNQIDPTFHNVGLSKDNKLKIFDFGAKPIKDR